MTIRDEPGHLAGVRRPGPVRIGDNVWFGVNCVVTGGVEIGDRAVIGANSVVTRDVPAGTIAAGAPAKVIREIEFKRGGGGEPRPDAPKPIAALAVALRHLGRDAARLLRAWASTVSVSEPTTATSDRAGELRRPAVASDDRAGDQRPADDPGAGTGPRAIAAA